MGANWKSGSGRVDTKEVQKDVEMELVGYKSKQLRLWLVLTAIILLVYPYITVFASELGGYISEKLISRSGVASSELVIGRSGVNNSTLDVGIGAIVSTLPATNIVDASTMLNGRLSDMNGMPQAIVYFEWGYNTGYGNTSSSQTLTGTGDFLATIGGYDSKKTIHFRAVSETDGTLYGANQTFEVGDRVSAYSILSSVLLILIAVIMCITVIRLASSPVAFLVMTIIGILAWLIVRAILGV